MISVLTDQDAGKLAEQLGALPLGSVIHSIYAINQKHFAWVSVPSVVKAETPAPKVRTKGTK